MTCNEFCLEMLEKAQLQTKGCRNIREQAARLAMQYAKENGTGPETEFCVRIRIENLGNSKYPDFRKVLDTVRIVKKTKTLYIGESGERVRPESIVQFCPMLY